MGAELIIIICLMAIAIGLIIAEIFLFPGISIAGIGGTILAIGGIAYAYSINQEIGHMTIGGSIIAFTILFWWLMRSDALQVMALSTDVGAQLESMKEKDISVGDIGKTISRLAPVGTARFGTTRIEVRSRNGIYIAEDKQIRVTYIDSSQVLVEEVHN